MKWTAIDWKTYLKYVIVLLVLIVGGAFMNHLQLIRIFPLFETNLSKIFIGSTFLSTFFLYKKVFLSFSVQFWMSVLSFIIGWAMASFIIIMLLEIEDSAYAITCLLVWLLYSLGSSLIVGILYLGHKMFPNSLPKEQQ